MLHAARSKSVCVLWAAINDDKKKQLSLFFVVVVVWRVYFIGVYSPYIYIYADTHIFIFIQIRNGMFMRLKSSLETRMRYLV